MASTAHTFEKYRDGYVRLINTMQVKSAWKPSLERIADELYSNKDRYLEVERTTNVPWNVIAVIHHLECGARFDLHLHNGDPLTARTRRVPRGYPKAPPQNGKTYTWEESAHDALVNRMKMHLVSDWSDAGVAYQLEKYNGFGYRQVRINSPYLWSGSNHYTRGKYVADGKWDANHVSQQAGAMLLYVLLRDMDKAEPVIEPSSGEQGKKSAPVEKRKKTRWLFDVTRIYNIIKAFLAPLAGLFSIEFWGVGKDILTTIKDTVMSPWGVVYLIGAGLFIYLLLEYWEMKSKKRKDKEQKEDRVIERAADRAEDRANDSKSDK